MRQGPVEKHFHAEPEKEAEQSRKAHAFPEGAAAGTAGEQRGERGGGNPSCGEEKKHPEQTGKEKPSGLDEGSGCGGLPGGRRRREKKGAEQKAGTRAAGPEPGPGKPGGKGGRRSKKSPGTGKHEQNAQGMTAHKGAGQTHGATSETEIGGPFGTRRV